MLNFPSSPTLGQQHTVAGKSWEWTGAAWKSISTTSALVERAEDAAAEAVASAAAAAQVEANMSAISTSLAEAHAQIDGFAADDGAGKVGNGGETVKESLDALQLPDYAALRAYSGPRKSVYVTGVLGAAAPAGIAGMFVRDDADATNADNGGTIIVASNGKRWKRQYSGATSVDWFGFSAATTTAARRAAVQAAINLGVNLDFPPGQYDLGDVQDAQTIFSVSGKYRVHYKGNNTRFTVNMTTSGIATIFSLANSAYLEFSGMEFVDNGFNRNVNWRGVRVFLFATDLGACNNITFRNLYCRQVVQFISSLAMNDQAIRSRGVTVDNVRVNNSYYGINCPGNIDYMTVRNYICDDVLRSWFCYGVRHHDVDVLSMNHPPASADVFIKSYVYPTQDIRLKYRAEGNLATGGPLVAIELQDDTAVSEVSNIDIDYDDSHNSNLDPASSIIIHAYTANATLEPVTSKTIKNIRLKGYARAGVKIASSVTKECQIFTDGQILDATRYAFLAEGYCIVMPDGSRMKAVAGNLSAKTISFDIGFKNAAGCPARIKTMMRNSQADFSGGTTFNEDAVFMYNAGGGPVGVASTTNIAKIPAASSAVVSYAGSAENLVVSFAGYAGADGYALVTMKFNG